MNENLHYANRIRWMRLAALCGVILLGLKVTPVWSAVTPSVPTPNTHGALKATVSYSVSTKRPVRPSPPPFWARFPIARIRGRRLRVLIYARYSTEEQDPRSIEDQAAYCRRFLGMFGLTDEDLEITLLCDREMSGEIIFRPGIDEVRAGLKARLWDLIVVEDVSRLFRDVAACIELVRIAVDQGIRVIAINDEIDTDDEENWEDRLYDAARHHAKTNRFTSKRIKRTHEALFEMKAAIGKLKPGYLRLPFYEGGDPSHGPFRDDLDPQWKEVMYQTYEKVAAKEPPWTVGQFMTNSHFPKASGATTAEYTDRNVIDFIKRKDHRGVQEFRITVSKKILQLGKRISERNPDPTKILVREMPELRVVPDALWYRASDAISNRRKSEDDPLTGRDHPLAGIPRDSRGPLSQIFGCSCCPGNMIVDGRGYRCRNARKHNCWNKATSPAELVHKQIGDAIRDRLRKLDTELDLLIEQVRGIFDDRGLRQSQKEERLQTEREAVEALKNLAKLAEKAQELPDIILERMKYWQDTFDRARADREYYALQEQRLAVPTRALLDERIEQLTAQLQTMKRTVRSELGTLVTRIEAVPYRQFGTNLVVLRARLQLNLAGLLPASVRAALAASCDGSINERFGSIPMLVDLFQPSSGPKHGQEALRLKMEEGLGLTAIGRRLGINKRQANIAVKYGKAMQAAGLTDPYIEVKEEPESASRWRRRGSRKAQQDSKNA